MAKYHMSAAITVSAYTVVEADSLEEAIEISKGREGQLGYNGCGFSDDEVWLVEDVDGEPTEIRGEEA